MDFLKKNKTVVIISLIVLTIVGLFVWYFNREKTTATGTGTGTGAGTGTASDPIRAKITEKMNQIKDNPEWYNNIKAGYQAQGYTLNQALASTAIWGLKVDGKIPMDTYGAGEWGHVAYVKQNFA